MKGFLSQLFEVACPPQALAKSLGLFCNDDKDAPAKEAQRENTLQQVSAGFFQVLARCTFKPDKNKDRLTIPTECISYQCQVFENETETL